jgi:signal transduction histidine kinase
MKAHLVRDVLAALSGALLSMVAGLAALRAAQRLKAAQDAEEMSRLRHDIRRALTVIQGEVELILSQDGVPADERQTSSQSILEEVRRVEELLNQTMLPTA